MQRRRLFFVCNAVLWLSLPVAFGQGGGGFGGSYTSGARHDYSNQASSWDGAMRNVLSTEAALNVIKIEGTAELRVRPEEIRVVIALTSEGVSAQECQEKVKQKVSQIRADWTALNISSENVVEDFISVLPRYAWVVDREEDGSVWKQTLGGYRMQLNLHVAVKTEAEAMQAIEKAFAHGAAEIVTFDYWSSDLEEKRREAMQAAMKSAQQKAEILLKVFSGTPPVVNVQEETAVNFPTSLYTTYENVLADDYVNSSYLRDRPAIRACRPKMTFYHGLQSNADVRPKRVPLHPEISVVSTVRIYYRSPADREKQKD